VLFQNIIPQPSHPMALITLGRIILIIIVSVALICPPVGNVLQRAGYSKWWALVAIVSPLNIIALWIFAYADWPSAQRGSN
jgi:hypothetical protein